MSKNLQVDYIILLYPVQYICSFLALQSRNKLKISANAEKASTHKLTWHSSIQLTVTDYVIEDRG